MCVCVCMGVYACMYVCVGLIKTGRREGSPVPDKSSTVDLITTTQRIPPHSLTTRGRGNESLIGSSRVIMCINMRSLWLLCARNLLIRFPIKHCYSLLVVRT